MQPTTCDNGTRYQATVPDTLDLAERARLALHGIANTVDPDDDFMMWFNIFWNNNPPYMRHSGADMDCTAKFFDALTLLRLASGSRDYLDIERGMEKSLLGCLDSGDGLYYANYEPRRRGWHFGDYYTPGKAANTEDYVILATSGIMLTALVVRNDLGLTPCEEQIRALCRGLEKWCVQKDDYAYYPVGDGTGHPFTCTRSGWKDTREPAGEHEGAENTVVYYHGYQIRGLAMWAQRSGDEQALHLAGKLARFVMKPKFWGNSADPAHVIGCEQGHVDYHFHARAAALRGLLEYGIVSGDARICDFVRSAYEYMRSYGISSIGYVPCWPTGAHYVEGCLLGDLVAMAVKMSRAGIGDYWDDADRIIRNHLAEAQNLRRDLLERVSLNDSQDQPQGHPGQISTDGVLDRMLGTFASYLMPTSSSGRLMQCCTANAARGIAFAWDGILDGEGDRVRVNLLLNRASTWLDVDSYLPYEGKVVILNKTARRVAVRIPSWVNRRKIKASVNGAERQADWVGAYQLFDDLEPGDIVQIEFPVVQQTVHLTAKTGPTNCGPIPDTTYAITFRGNTVVDITPRDAGPTCYPMYLREEMKGDRAPMKTVERFAPDKVARW